MHHKLTNIKNTLIFLIIQLAFKNVSYASFPITDNFEIKQDALKTEEIKQYHYNLQKFGINLNAEKCESCRNGIAPLTKKREVNKPPN